MVTVVAIFPKDDFYNMCHLSSSFFSATSAGLCIKCILTVLKHQQLNILMSESGKQFGFKGVAFVHCGLRN